MHTIIATINRTPANSTTLRANMLGFSTVSLVGYISVGCFEDQLVWVRFRGVPYSVAGMLIFLEF